MRNSREKLKQTELKRENKIKKTQKSIKKSGTVKTYSTE